MDSDTESWSWEDLLSRAENLTPFTIVYALFLLELTIAVAYYRPLLALLSLSMFVRYKQWQSSPPQVSDTGSTSADLKMGALYASAGCISLAGIAEHDIFLALLVAVVVTFLELAPYGYQRLLTAFPVTNPPPGQARVE
jgi:hypothetical protein